MNYVYPKLSKYDLFFFRLGGSGLGNLLFTYSRALVFAEENGFELIYPTWPSLKVGTFLRNEKDKRFYNDLFQNTSKYISGLKKIKLLTSKHKLNEKDFKPGAHYDDTVFIFDEYIMNFESLISYRSLIYDNLMLNLQEKNKEPLERNFADSINVHIRLGDFAKATESELFAGNNNLRLPIEWYVEIINKVRQSLGRCVRVNIFSDGTDAELKPVTDLENVHRISFGTSIADIIGLSKSPLIISSGSTFSMWARFLGGNSSIAFTNQLKCKNLCNENGFEIELGLNEEFSDELKDRIRELYF